MKRKAKTFRAPIISDERRVQHFCFVAMIRPQSPIAASLALQVMTLEAAQ